MWLCSSLPLNADEGDIKMQITLIKTFQRKYKNEQVINVLSISEGLGGYNLYYKG